MLSQDRILSVGETKSTGQGGREEIGNTVVTGEVLAWIYIICAKHPSRNKHTLVQILVFKYNKNDISFSMDSEPF